MERTYKLIRSKMYEADKGSNASGGSGTEHHCRGQCGIPYDDHDADSLPNSYEIFSQSDEFGVNEQ